VVQQAARQAGRQAGREAHANHVLCAISARLPVKANFGAVTFMVGQDQVNGLQLSMTSGLQQSGGGGEVCLGQVVVITRLGLPSSRAYCTQQELLVQGLLLHRQLLH
jgi:hypothetical protein